MESTKYLAYKFRLENYLSGLPLEYNTIVELIHRKGYQLKTYDMAADDFEKYGLEEYAEERNAFATVSKQGKVCIYINNLMPIEDKVAALLHELGHLYCSHSNYGILGLSPDEFETNVQEKEAEEWRRYVCAPPCVLKARKVNTVPKIITTTLLNREDATKIYMDMYECPKQPESETEKKLCYLMGDTNSRKIDKIIINRIFGGSLAAISMVISVLGALSAFGALASPALAEQGAPSLPSGPLSSVLLSSQDVPDIPSDITSSVTGEMMTSDTTTSRESVAPPSTGGATTEPTTPNNPVSQYTPQYTKSSSWAYTYPSKAATPLSGVMVCVTQAGDKYHLEGCPHLDGHSYTKMDRSTAKDEGLEPCLTCSPDSARASLSEAASVSPSEPTSSAWVQFNLNTATLEQIKSIPGLSDSAAENIYEFREAAGYFGSIDEILNVPGCGYATRNLLKEYCYLEK